MDILLLAGASGTTFIAKAELCRTPLVGWLARLNRTVFVERDRKMAIGDEIAELRRAMTEERTLTVFPEGTTSDGTSLLPFKTAVFRIMEDAQPQASVQPVVIDYGAATSSIAWGGDESGLTNCKRILARPGTFRVNIRFLEPFDPSVAGDRKAIARLARDRIKQAFTASECGLDE